MNKWFLLIVFALFSCKGPSGVPGNVLGYNEMKEVMWDMAQVDEFAVVYIHGTPQKVKDENLLLYQKVFALHKISDDEFAKSYIFYKTHPVQQKILMDSLLQFSTKQRLERYVPPTPLSARRLPKLLNPATLRIDNIPNDWHRYEFQTNFLYE